MARDGYSSPFRDLLTLGAAMDRFLEDRWSPQAGWPAILGGKILPLDVYETAEEFVVRAQVPGVKPEDIDIEFEHGVLTLRATTATAELPQGGNWLLMEIPAGEVVRQLSLPRSIDAEKAATTFDNGVLTVTLPKAADAKPRQIKVGSAPQLGAGSTA